MPVEARAVTLEQVPAIVDAMRLLEDEREAVLEGAGASELMWAISADDQPFVLCGFIPRDVFGVQAYAWMEWTPALYDHPKASTKLCVAIFTEARRKFPLIYGHCSYGPRPMALLKRIGARFWTAADGRPAYVIGET